jgi:hypothetical protein
MLIFAERRCGMLLVDDQDTVEEFTADAADEAFNRVGPRRPDRCRDDADVDGGEYGVERRGELGVAVPDEELELVADVVEIHEQVARQLGQPRSGWVSGDAEDVHRAGDVFDDEERIQPAQGDGVYVEQVAGEDRRLRS